MFRMLFDYTIERLQACLGATPLAVPAEYARQAGLLRGQPLTMTNVAFETEHLRKVRLTYMAAGDAAQILTTMAFPRTHTDLPIFGADVLGFKGKPHLIVIDHQPLYKHDPAYSERYIAPLASLHARYAHLPARGRALPAWTEEFFSPYTHYSRPEAEHLDAVRAAYRDYWDAYLHVVESVSPLPASEHARIHARQAAYCRNHIENEQAEGMMHRLFGEAFTTRFINEFLFDVHDETPLQEPSI